MSYIREAGALRSKRPELLLLLVCRQGFLRRRVRRRVPIPDWTLEMLEPSVPPR